MKRMNDVYEDRPMSLKEKVLREIGERLANVGGPCTILVWYEPSLPQEIIESIDTE